MPEDTAVAESKPTTDAPDANAVEVTSTSPDAEAASLVKSSESEMLSVTDLDTGQSVPVKKSEKDKLLNSAKHSLIFESRLLDMDCWSIYLFTQDRLTRTKYMVQEDHSNKNDYILDYRRFKAALSKKYGEPTQDKHHWRDDLYKDDYSDWGLAISIGHLQIYTEWNTPETSVFLSLMGDKFEVSLEVQYTSKELKILEKKASEEKIMDDL